MKWICAALLAACSLAILDTVRIRSGEAPPAVPHRSPVGLALLPGGQRALTANHIADSVSLVDLVQGKVLAEQAVGRKPAAIAAARDGRRAAVSNLWSGSVTLLEVRDAALRVLAEVKVGSLPRGLLFAPDGATLYVALAGADEVISLDWQTQAVTRRLPAAREPYDLALAADGKTLAAVSSRSAQVRVWDAVSGKLRWERTMHESFNIRGLTFSPDEKHLLCAYPFRRDLPVTQHNIASGWVIDNRLGMLPLAAEAQPEYWQLALDLRGEAVGDPHGVAFSKDGKTLAVTAPGTHELLLLKPAHLPWSPGEPGDFIDVALEIGQHKMERIELGGRPLALAFVDDHRTVAVANYLLDSVQVVDLTAGKIVRTVALGGPAAPALARQGEALFYDAKRAHHQWFSCHTCHTDGHTSAMRFDTLNDDTYANPKQTPSLRNVTKTGPWTWHGWQKDLKAAIEKSLTDTMFGVKPQSAEVEALAAYLATLTPPPNPHRAADGKLTPAAERGRALFTGKAHCVRCHKGELFYSESNYDVKLGNDGSGFDLYNPPSLVGLWDRGPYLHDSRTDSLDYLLRIYHGPDKLGGQKLSDAERADLIEYLQGL